MLSRPLRGAQAFLATILGQTTAFQDSVPRTIFYPATVVKHEDNGKVAALINMLCSIIAIMLLGFYVRSQPYEGVRSNLSAVPWA